MLISPEYALLNQELHMRCQSYGTNNVQHYIGIIQQLMDLLHTQDILDYGCGKGDLGKLLLFPIKEYDPAIPGKTKKPDPADIVVCTDVLEHVEPECLNDVLGDLRRCLKRIGLFVVPTHQSSKFLSDGRNAHLTQQGGAWWKKKIGDFFIVHDSKEVSCITHVTPGIQMIGSYIYFLVLPQQGDNGNGRR